jgi:hypothetical protein
MTSLRKLGLKSINFGGLDRDVFTLREGLDLSLALNFAVDLNLAIGSLCDRLDNCINNNEDPVTCAELRALSHLSETSAALLQSIRSGLRAEGAGKDE